MVDLPDHVKCSDPLRGAIIQRCVDGIPYRAKVVDIVVGSRSMQRLYLVWYDDGDIEHLTEDLVVELQVPKPACVFCRGTGLAGFSACPWCAT